MAVLDGIPQDRATTQASTQVAENRARFRSADATVTLDELCREAANSDKAKQAEAQPHVLAEHAG